MTPEVYILRIYRRSVDPPRDIAGRVETPSGELGAGFATLAQLSAILESPKASLRQADAPEAPSAAHIKVYRQEGQGD
jgi:hypothetical protein